ncbi:MAG: DUF3368 domain-containing protein [Bacteroidia bacterium]
MKKGLVISDTGPIFSLAVIDRLDILDALFDEVAIPQAVWEELTRNPQAYHFKKIVANFQDRVRKITEFNNLTFVMDYGESEAVILYKELNANYLLIDDRKARQIAQNFGINCVGTIGILSIARTKGFITELKPVFKELLDQKGISQASC